MLECFAAILVGPGPGENKNRESYLFGPYNKLQPKTELLNDDRDNDDLDYQEIISHNSKYWSYFNVLNIAILMKESPLYCSVGCTQLLWISEVESILHLII